MQIFAKSLSLSINPANLVALATGGQNSTDTIPELKGYDVKNIGNDALRDAMVRRQQKAQEELIESAAEQLVGVLAATDIAIQNQLAELRRIRDTEKQILASIKQLNLAQAYANKTSNFIPLMDALGIKPANTPAGYAQLAVIPDSFTVEYFAEKKPARTAAKAK